MNKINQNLTPPERYNFPIIKRTVSILLSATLIAFSFIGCNEEKVSAPPPTTTAQITTEAALETTTVAETTITETTAAEEVPKDIPLEERQANLGEDEVIGKIISLDYGFSKSGLYTSYTLHIYEDDFHYSYYMGTEQEIPIFVLDSVVYLKFETGKSNPNVRHILEYQVYD